MSQSVLSDPEELPVVHTPGLSTERAALAIAGVMLISIAALAVIWFALGVFLR